VIRHRENISIFCTF